MLDDDSYDVYRKVDDIDGNLCKGNAHNSFDVDKAIPFFDNYDIHALLRYVFAHLHYVDIDHGRI